MLINLQYTQPQLHLQDNLNLTTNCHTSQLYELREYQKDLLKQLLTSLDSGNSSLVQLPTGGGKTVILSHLVKEFLRRGKRVLFLAHRTELLTQASGKIAEITGVQPQLLTKGVNPDGLVFIQSQQCIRNRYLENIGLVVIDEAHRSLSPTYEKAVKHYRAAGASIVGVTATPQRTDGKGLGAIFERLIEGVTVSQLIEQGHLVDYKIYVPETLLKGDGLKKQAGDYSSQELETLLDSSPTVQGDLITAYKQHAKGLKTLVFTINKRRALLTCEDYQRAGIKANVLTSDTEPKERERILNDFRAGAFNVLVNCQILTEGFDLPAIEAVQIARPTASLILWLQMIGRGLRPSNNKEFCLILDHTDNHQKHPLPKDPIFWSLSDKPKFQTKNYVRLPYGELVPVTTAEESRELEEHYLKIGLIELDQTQQRGTAEAWREGMGKAQIKQIDQLVKRFNASCKPYEVLEMALIELPDIKTLTVFYDVLGTTDPFERATIAFKRKTSLLNKRHKKAGGYDYATIHP